jgi:ankyrin repeat protein
MSALSVQLNELLEFPLDIQIEILNRLPNESLLDICEAPDAPGVCNNNSLWLDVIRRRYGEETYRAARDMGSSKTMDNFKQIIALDQLDPEDLVRECDEIAFLEGSSDPFVNALCVTPYFDLKYLQEKYGSIEEAIVMDNTDILQLYLENGTPGLFDRSPENNLLVFVRDRRLNFTQPIHAETIRILLEAGVTLEDVNPLEKDSVLREFIQTSPEVLTVLLEDGVVTPDYRDNNGNTILMLVASALPEKVFYTERLLEEEIFRNTINEVNTNDETALILAYENDNLNIVRMFLDVRSPPVNVQQMTDEGMNVLDIALSQHVPDLDLIRRLLRKSVINGRLIENVRSPEVLDILLTETVLYLPKYADSRNARYTEAYLNQTNESLTAIEHGREAEIAQQLKDAGATFTNINAQDSSGNTLLMKMVKRGNVEEVRNLLEEGADPNTADNDGNTALFFIGKDSFYEILPLLLNKGAKVNHQNNQGRTFLYFIAAQSYPTVFEVARKLLEVGANPNIPDENGMTPLLNVPFYHAVEFKNMVAVLVEGDANINHSDNEGKTLLDKILRLWMDDDLKIQIADYLMELGATPTPDNVNTLFSLYLNQGFLSEEKLAKALALIEAGADIASKDSEGGTILFQIRLFSNKDLLKNVLDAGGKDIINVTDNEGRTVLDFVLGFGDSDLSTLLSKYGAKRGEELAL